MQRCECSTAGHVQAIARFERTALIWHVAWGAGVRPGNHGGG